MAYSYPDDDDYNDARDEARRMRKPHGCSDGMCGATDCPTCYPGSWMNDGDEESEDNDDVQ